LFVPNAMTDIIWQQGYVHLVLQLQTLSLVALAKVVVIALEPRAHLVVRLESMTSAVVVLVMVLARRALVVPPILALLGPILLVQLVMVLEPLIRKPLQHVSRSVRSSCYLVLS